MQNEKATTRKTTTHDAENDPRNDDILIWVNGELTPRAEATVSVYDSGFLLGDGMWEGLRLHRGKWVSSMTIWTASLPPAARSASTSAWIAPAFSPR
jgi:hypothetical protein